ncbi:MAG: D-alanyl-D-alanine carboxypeptidase family protein, partial [Fimbriimonadaceae bacterium]
MRHAGSVAAGALVLAGFAVAQTTPPPPRPAEFDQNGPKVVAQTALIMDADTGRVLWAKNPHQRMHPASTTKLLTAILLLENTSPNEQIVATESCEKVIGSSLRLKPGERVSSADMLKAIMLRSANDACHSIALHIAGSEKAFAEKMNSRAKALGARNSTFTNPHGLTAEGHRSTAFDLAMIGKAALMVPEIAEVAQLQEASISRSVDQTFTKFENRNRFLKHDPTATGLKTGYTLAAGNTFVGSVRRGDQTIITSILSSKDWFQDQINMTEWAFSNLSV